MSRTMNHEEWTDLLTASRMLGVGIRTLPKCAANLGIRVRTIPGRKGALYSLPDIQAALARMEEAEAAAVAAASWRTNVVATARKPMETAPAAH